MGSFSAFHWFVIFGFIGLIVLAVRSKSAGPAAFCNSCGHEGPSKRKTRGHILLEIVLWLCFLVPGLIYSVWRMTSKQNVCSACGATTLIPANSPMALASKKQMQDAQ